MPLDILFLGIVTDLWTQLMGMDETTSLTITALAAAFSAVAAVFSTLVAVGQVSRTRKTARYSAVSGLSCSYYTQGQEWPEDFDPEVPGEWSDLEVVFRLDNVSDFPFTAVTAVFDLPERQLRAFVEWVPPRTVLYCKAGFADEHEFMHRETVAGVGLTFVDSSGFIWQRTPEGRLRRRRFVHRRGVWRLWRLAGQRLRSLLPKWLKPRSINQRPHYGATLAGLGEPFDENSTKGEYWMMFEPSQEVVQQDKHSAPPHHYVPQENEPD